MLVLCSVWRLVWLHKKLVTLVEVNCCRMLSFANS